MTNKDIENYLSEKNDHLDSDIGEQIENFRLRAITDQNETQANYFWCLGQIYKIQKGFVSAIQALKDQKYEDAWLTLDHIDIALSNLEGNFDIEQDNDRYHIVFIGRMIKEYQKLYPYHYFFSRENIIKVEKCTICGQPISLRRPCPHKVGKLYMGELCLREVTDMELKSVSLVTDPFDKYAFVKLEGKEYNYGMLEQLMPEINSPYDDFYIETIKVKKPEFKAIARNSQCPCGSGKKYKRCHCGKADEMMDHHIINMEKTIAQKTKFVGYFGTWK